MSAHVLHSPDGRKALLEAAHRSGLMRSACPPGWLWLVIVELDNVVDQPLSEGLDLSAVPVNVQCRPVDQSMEKAGMPARAIDRLRRAVATASGVPAAVFTKLGESEDFNTFNLKLRQGQQGPAKERV